MLSPCLMTYNCRNPRIVTNFLDANVSKLLMAHKDVIGGVLLLGLLLLLGVLLLLKVLLLLLLLMLGWMGGLRLNDFCCGCGVSGCLFGIDLLFNSLFLLLFLLLMLLLLLLVVVLVGVLL